MQIFYRGTAEAGRDYRFTGLGASLYIGHLDADGKVQTVRPVLSR